MINRNKLEHILEYAKQQRHIGQSCKVPPEDMVEIMERLLSACNPPAQSDCCPAQNSVAPTQNQGWIPVSERLPDQGDHVLVSDGVGMEVSWIRGREWKKLRHIYSEDVTHWMPLPAAPQEVK